MAVSDSSGFSGPYLANGATTVFPFTFEVLSSDQVAVLLRDADGGESVADPSSYTVNLSGAAPSAGAAAFTSAPAAGLTVLVYLAPAFTSDAAFENGSAWLAKPVNDGYDHSALRDQALRRDLDRAVLSPMGDAGFTLPPAADRASRLLGFDTGGSAELYGFDAFKGVKGDPGAGGLAVGLFVELGDLTIPGGTDLIQTAGFDALGKGAGTYVCDAEATSELAAGWPRFCKQTANGRYFRLLPNAEGLIPVACGGAHGGPTPITNASADDRAAIQAAEAYKHVIGANGLLFTARNYAIRRVPRTDLTTWDHRMIGYQGSPIVVLSSTVWKSAHPEGSLLLRRKPDGTTYDVSDYQTVVADGIGAATWRGGMIFVEGQTVDPADPATGSVTLDGIQLDGGLRYVRDSLTFEVLDKPLWQSNDRYCGNITLRGKTSIVGFSSELIYSAAATPASATKRFLTIEPTVVLGETGGSCINANGITLRVERCLCFSAFIGIEGWTGEAGGFLKAHFRDCNRNSIQGGTYTPAPGFYYTPNAPTPGTLPLGELDVTLERSNGFQVGSWIKGRVTLIDCSLPIGGADVFGTSGAECVDLEIVSIADRTSPVGAVQFAGGASGLMSIRNITLRITTKQTDYAKANGFKVAAAVWYYGSIGPGVIVTLNQLEGSKAESVAGSIYDWGITYKGYVYQESDVSSYFDIEANNGATLIPSPLTAFSCSGTASGVKTVNLPTVKVNPGHRMYLANFTRNFVNPGLDLKVNGSNFRSGTDEHFAANYSAICVEFAGGIWRVVERL